MSALQKTGERQVGTQLEEIREDHRERYEWAVSRLASTDSILDAGCGVGYGSYLMAAHVREVLAVDVSAESIRYASRYWARDNVRHEIHDLHALHLPAGTSFDAVVAFEVVEHLVDPRLFLLRVAPHLKPGGRLYISIPNEKVVPHTVELNPFHMRHYTSKEVRDLLAECGFTVQQAMSQNTTQLAPGEGGRFLIIEAVRGDTAPVGADPLTMTARALSVAADYIVARAIALVKARKDVAALKVRLEDATKRASTDEGRTSLSPELSAALTNIGRHVESIEGALITDIRRRHHELEISERTLRDALTQQQLQVVRLEDERRFLQAQLSAFEAQRRSLEDEVARLLARSEATDARLATVQAAADAAASQVRAAQSKAAEAQARADSASVRLLAVAGDQRLLSKANEELAARLAKADAENRKLKGSLLTLHAEQKRALEEARGQRPSLGQLLRTLRREKLFVPYVLQAAGNTLRSRIKRRRGRR